jgi:hypothetical protein
MVGIFSYSTKRRRAGIFAQILMGLAEQASDNKTISIDATYLKAHRTASSLRLKKGGEDA